jgi:hypothetical protein
MSASRRARRAATAVWCAPVALGAETGGVEERRDQVEHEGVLEGEVDVVAHADAAKTLSKRRRLSLYRKLRIKSVKSAQPTPFRWT